jgi:RNase P/RNase MRP subunit p30
MTDNKLEKEVIELMRKKAAELLIRLREMLRNRNKK